jgi:uncharacterized protein
MYSKIGMPYILKPALEKQYAKVAHTEFKPRRGIRGGHLQTLASHLLGRKVHLPPPEERLIEVEPGVKVLCHCHWQADRARALTVIVVHGLEGSSDSGYMLGITDKGLSAGMNVVRMNQRNCGGTENIAATLYHSGLSSDMAVVARILVDQEHLSGFALAGYSMGGNLALKLAGEWGREGPPQLRAVATVCPAMDLAASADALHNRTNWLYEQYFLRKLRRRMQAKAALFPGTYDLSRLQGLKSLRDFDDRVTAYYCGFKGADDYYARAAAANVVDKIAVPALIINAANDPFIRITPQTRAKVLANPNIKFVETADGGHCSFLAEPNGYDGHWAERQVIEFLRQFQD